jgi:TatD related DNase
MRGAAANARSCRRPSVENESRGDGGGTSTNNSRHGRGLALRIGGFIPLCQRRPTAVRAAQVRQAAVLARGSAAQRGRHWAALVGRAQPLWPRLALWRARHVDRHTRTIGPAPPPTGPAPTGRRAGSSPHIRARRRPRSAARRRPIGLQTPARPRAKGRTLLARLPHDRVVLETDGRTPTGRGRPREPTDLATLVEDLARLWQTNLAQVRASICENQRRPTDPGPAPGAAARPG